MIVKQIVVKKHQKNKIEFFPYTITEKVYQLPSFEKELSFKQLNFGIHIKKLSQLFQSEKTMQHGDHKGTFIHVGNQLYTRKPKAVYVGVWHARFSLNFYD